MLNDDLVLFLRGATGMGCMILAVFFLRFWSRAHDRLFLIFAVAFALLAIHYVLIVTTAREETEALVYAVRALAFALILLAILDKNRRP